MGLFDWLRKQVGVSSTARVESLLGELFQSFATLADQGRWGEALPLAQRAADLGYSHLDEAHPDYARSLTNLAATHMSMGDHAAALPLVERALEIRRATLGRPTPTTPVA